MQHTILNKKAFLMAKQTDPIPQKHKRLNELKVKRSIERTNIYDSEIKKLQKDLDYFDFGII